MQRSDFETVYMRAAKAGSSAVGKVVTNAIGVPIVGDVVGWGVENSMNFFVEWVQAAIKYKDECRQLSEMLHWQQLQQGLIDLDQVTDFPEHQVYRFTYHHACEVVAEFNFVLAQHKASNQLEEGWRMKAWDVLKGSFESLFDARKAMKASLLSLYSFDEHLKFSGHKATGTFTAKVSNPPKLVCDAPELPKHFVQHGADLVPDITNLLRTFCNVGIVGMPGIGKTAVARAVYERARTTTGGAFKFANKVWLTVGFDADGGQSSTCMLQPMKSAIKQLSGKESRCSTLKYATEELERLVAEKRQEPDWSVLLVLDNVWDSTAIATLNFATLDYGKATPAAGSRLIVTTRQRSTLAYGPRPRQGFAEPLSSLHVIEVPRLHKQHAHCLFHHMAHEDNFDDIQAGRVHPGDERFWPKVRAQMLHECGGNPSAVLHVAHRVRLSDPEDWEHDLKEFRAIVMAGKDAVSGACEHSLDVLPESVRECFVAFAAFRPDEWVPEADVVHLFATRAPLHTAASVQAAACKLLELVQCSLVNMRAVAEGMMFSMHPILHRIAVRKARAVRGLANSHHFEVSNVKVNNVQCLSINHELHSNILADVLEPYHGKGSKLHVCVISCVKDGAPPTKWPPRLRYLHLRGGPAKSSKQAGEHYVLSSAGLSSAYVLSSAGQRRSSTESAIANLLVLNSLNLAGSMASNAPLRCFLPAGQLRHLDLSGCGGLESLPESIGLCFWLMHLNLSRCTKLNGLPELQACIHLEVLDLSECAGLTSLRTGIKGNRALKQLNLRGCSHSQLQLSLEVRACSNLIELNLSGLSGSGQASLPQLFKNLPSAMALKHIDISGCSELSSLPRQIGNCSYLTCLNLRGCSGLGSNAQKVAIPSSIACCTELVCLDFSECTCLLALPDAISSCTKLKYLHLWGCSSLTGLPGSLGDNRELVHVSLGKHTRLSDVPECISRHTTLARLTISDFSSLPNHAFSNADPAAGAAQSGCLTRLDLHRCGGLHWLSSSCRRYSSLMHLQAEACSGKCFTLPPCVHLTHLTLKACPDLQELPSSIISCTQLAHLDLDGCSKLACLPDRIGSCTQLTHLNLRGCSLLSKLPQTICDCSELAHLCLQECSSLATLPREFSRCSQLTHLDLSMCTALTLPPTPDIIECGNQLADLSLHGWSHDMATRLPPTQDIIGCGNQLAYLSLRGWSQATALPACIGSCVHVTHLDLSQCPKVTKLPDGIGNCMLVSQLSFQGCSSITTLPESIGRCIHLTSLDLKKCSKLEKLPDTLKDCKALVTLVLDPGKCVLTNRDEFKRLSWAKISTSKYPWMHV